MKKFRYKLSALVLSILMLLSSVPAAPVSGTEALSTNVNCPFERTVNFPLPNGTTTTSNSYRIPAMVTLADGTIVAAADIRWNTTYDGGGLDTLVARSTDGGVSWSYVTANYLGDNGNEYNGSNSTCFIDPCLTVAADGQTVYMLTDLYPYGIALNGSGNKQPSTSVGFNDAGKLLLSNNDHITYGYYLDGGKIYSSNGVEQSGYTVDEYFNITGTDGTDSNLFFADSPFKVVRTGFLYLTKSTDGGASWSAPTLLDLKTSSEQVCLVGPGRGLTTKNGVNSVMVFPVYKYNGDASSQRLSFIYSTDGINWTRSSELNRSWASEAAVVELKNGNLRFFYRNGTSTLRYADYNLTSNTWVADETTGIATNSNTQISAITYSKTSDGKQVILVSCPKGPDSTTGSNQSGASYRENGRIFVFTVDSAGSMTNVNTINVNENNASFMYSCLTERSDGSIAILYEDHENAWGEGSNCYYEMSMKAYSASELRVTFDADSGSTDPEPPAPEEPTADQTITLDPGQSTTVTVSDSANVGTAGSFSTADGCVDYKIEHLSTGFGYELDSNGVDSESKYLITLGTNYVVNTTSSSSNDWKVNSLPIHSLDFSGNMDLSGYLWTITETTGGYYIQNPAGKYMDISTVYEINNNYLVTLSDYPVVCDITPSGTGYMIFANNSYIGLNNAGGSNQTALGWYKQSNTVWNLYKYSPSSGTTATFSATDITSGTYVTIGDTVYKVIVNPVTSAESVFVVTGGQKTLDAVADLGLSGTGYTVTYSVTEDGSSVISTIENGVITANATNNGTATVVAEVKNSAGNTVGTVTYTVSVADVQITDTKNVYVAVEHNTEISSLSGDLVSSMLDTTLATVDYTGGTLTITGVKEGVTSVVVGTTQFNIYVNRHNTGKGADTTKYIYVNVTQIEHCTVYYAINGGTLHKVEGTGVLIDQAYNDGINLMFFAKPDDGYALTSMSATGTVDQYYSMLWNSTAGVPNDRNDASYSDAWPFNNADQTETPAANNSSDWKTINGALHGFRWALLEGNFNISELRDLYTRAYYDLKVHGATNFTKNGTGTTTNAANGNNLITDLAFIAEKLPTMEKTIVKVERDGAELTFNQNTVLRFGDVITYQFTVTSSTTVVEYSDITLTDSLIGFSQTIADNTFDTAGTYTYTATYTINQADLDKYTGGVFKNEAALNYTYSSEYSAGSAEASASASVSCRISGLVFYVWADNVPQAIKDDNNTYTLPGLAVQEYGTNFTVKSYTGATSYVATENGVTVGTWTFSHWEYNGNVFNGGDTATMPVGNSAGFVGVWDYTPAPTYTVTYAWLYAPAGVTLPTDSTSYYAGQQYTVNSTYASGTEFDDGTMIWTFSGWSLGNTVVSGNQTMGNANVTLTGSWSSEQKLTSLTISKDGYAEYSTIDPNQTFMFEITGPGVDLTVAVHGENSITVNGLTVGESYTVTEITDWAWRYELDSWTFSSNGNEAANGTNNGAEITLGDTENEITFINSREKALWLDGDSFIVNIFKKKDD